MTMTKYSGQVDYFSAGSGLVCTSSEVTIETSEGEAQDSHGDIAEISATIVGGTVQCDYEVKCTGDVELPTPGEVLTPGNLPPEALPNLVPTGASIETSAGAMPVVTVTGQLIDGACVDEEAFGAVKSWAGSLVPRARAQLLGGIAVTGAGASCTRATYAIEGQSATAPKDGTGKRGSISVYGLTVTATLEIAQSGSAEPAITAAGWTITQPLSPSGKIGEYTTWSAALKMPIARDAAGGGS